MSCMVCGKTSVRLFEVQQNYGTISHTVRDNIMEIFGNQVDWYLKQEEYVCNVCMNMLENFAKLKRRLWPLITKPSEHRKPIKLGKVWNIFASLQLEEEEMDDDCDLNNLPACRTPTPCDQNHLPPSRTPTPSNLLALNYTVPYSSSQEAVIERREYCRSRSSSRFGQSDASETSELSNIFRHRKRGHNWSRRKKRVRRSISRNPGNRSPTSDFSYSTSNTVTSFSRSNSVTSTRSFSTSRRSSPASRRSSVASRTSARSVVYDDQGRLITKRTRSVSRAQEEEEKNLERIQGSKFYCDEKDCVLYFEDLDVLNYHRVNDHNIRDLFFCDECKMRYTKREHLKLHSQCHDFLPFYCLMCAIEVPNATALQAHLDKHMVYSVMCKFCDMSFLSRNLLDDHVKAAHKDRRKRNIYRHKLITARFDKEEPPKKVSKSGKDEYKVYVSLHTDMARELGDLDITVENFREKNVDVVTNDGELPNGGNEVDEVGSVGNCSNSIDSEFSGDNNVDNDDVNIDNGDNNLDSEDVIDNELYNKGIEDDAVFTEVFNDLDIRYEVVSTNIDDDALDH